MVPFFASRKSIKSRAEQFAGYFFRAHDCLLQLGRGLFFLTKSVPSFLLLIEEKKAKEDQGDFGRRRSLAGYMQLGTSLFVSFEVPGQPPRPLFVAFKVPGQLGRRPCRLDFLLPPFLSSRKEKEKEKPPFLTSRKSPKSRAEQFAGYFFRMHDCFLQRGRGFFFLA